MRILVTGGAGYVGSHAAWGAIDAGHEVIIADDLSLSSDRFIPPSASFVRISIEHRGALADLMRQAQVDAVLHFAGLSRVGESVAQPDQYFRTNVGGTLSLLEAMRDANVQRIVFSSSAAVYGAPDRTPIREDAPIHPVNPYGDSKAIAETIIRRFSERGWIRAVALRYFNAAGADEQLRTGEAHFPETHLIPNMCAASFASTLPLQVFGDDYETRDGTCVRDYVHVTDLAIAHLLALSWLEDHAGFHTFNLGSESGYTVGEVLAEAQRAWGIPVPHVVSPRRAGDPPILVADSTSAERDLGWRREHSDLPNILKSAANWFHHLQGVGPDSPGEV